MAEGDGFRWDGDGAAAAIRGAAASGVAAAAEVYKNEMVRVLSAVDNEGPSAPLEAPHEESEEAARRGAKPLAETVEVFPGENPDFAEMAVGTRHRAAVYLELGTGDMLPRPAWARAAADTAAGMGEAVAEAVKVAIGG